MGCTVSVHYTATEGTHDVTARLHYHSVKNNFHEHFIGTVSLHYTMYIDKENQSTQVAQ